MAHMKLMVSAFLIRKFHRERHSPDGEDDDPRQPLVRGLLGVVEVMKRARFTVDLALFLINNAEMVRRLIKLNNNGVKIRLLLDHRHHHVQAPYARILKRRGIEVRWKPAETMVEYKTCLVDCNWNDPRLKETQSVAFVLYGINDIRVSNCLNSFPKMIESNDERILKHYNRQFNYIWTNVDSDSE